jgi:uncharacterized protein (TIGR04552 family)
MSKQELYHEIFGSILDRKEMTPYMLRDCGGYEGALQRANRMLANRGFDILADAPVESELERAEGYVKQAIAYMDTALLPFVRKQLEALADTESSAEKTYRDAIDSIDEIHAMLSGGKFRDLVDEDPRHLFLLSSSAKYPDLFYGYRGENFSVPRKWKMMGCTILKMCHLIKSIEEDSQDINDYAKLGMFLEESGERLGGLFDMNWETPDAVPTDESARRAFVTVAGFFRKLNQSVSRRDGALVFDSGDGVQVDIAEIKARLKSPESMFAKLGKDEEEEAYNIRDILAITFILKERDHALTLFHALQKRGVILQENTASTSITQTLFDSPAEMTLAVRHLAENLARWGDGGSTYTEEEIRRNADNFFGSLGMNAVRNPHTSDRHRKFQCKINFSVPVHMDAKTHEILVPGTPEYAARGSMKILTQQLTLPVELRISDVASWEESEKKGEAHHDAYKCRQLLALMDRLFSPLFSFPSSAESQLRADQEKIFV